MVDYGKVKSTIKPESVVIDDYSVWEIPTLKRFPKT